MGRYLNVSEWPQIYIYKRGERKKYSTFYILHPIVLFEIIVRICSVLMKSHNALQVSQCPYCIMYGGGYRAPIIHFDIDKEYCLENSSEAVLQFFPHYGVFQFGGELQFDLFLVIFLTEGPILTSSSPRAVVYDVNTNQAKLICFIDFFFFHVLIPLMLQWVIFVGI